MRKQQHLHSNLSLSFYSEQRALTHRDQDAETGCINNTADDGNQFIGKISHLPPNFKMNLRPYFEATGIELSTLNDVHISDVYIINVYTDNV